MFSAWTKNAWLLPVNYSNHWTLLMVLPKQKVIIYFDSLHGNPNNVILNGILTFLDIKLNVALDDWTLHMPNDIPSQLTIGIDGNTNAGGNCGVHTHICSWAYLIATGRMELTEADMNNARKGIATYLAEAKNEIKKEKRCVKSHNILLESENINSSNFNLVALIKKSNSCPFGFDNTVELCASLNLITNNDQKKPTTRYRK